MQRLEFRVHARSAAGFSPPAEPPAFSLEDLREAVYAALPRRSPGEDEEDGEEPSIEVLAESPEGTALSAADLVMQLIVAVEVRDVRMMQEMRNQVLSGDFDAAASRALEKKYRHAEGHPPVGGSLMLQADRTQFAAQFEDTVLALEVLTPHQSEKLAECGSHEGDVHLRAPAGAGKTFVALHRALDMLRRSPTDSVLFVARNEALAFFAASWIGKRAPAGERQQMLNRLHVMHEPFDQGCRAASVARAGCRVCAFLQPADAGGAPAEAAESTGDHRTRYALIVVDEAHHIYADPQLRTWIEALMVPGITRRLLLSDISQSLGRHVVYPEGLKDVVLSEVVRCSKRIVAGAMAFQLGGEEKLLTKCHHEATGPPLKSFLFDLPSGAGCNEADEASGGSSSSGKYRSYAEHCLCAVEHVVSVFPGLSLHNRLAFVVPDTDFLERLRPELLSLLAEKFPLRQFCLVSSATASADIGEVGAGEEDGSLPALPSDMSPEGEWLVLDSIPQVDGLERLIVVGVGLDSVIGGEQIAGSEAVDSGALETRSMLYRAVTRAHLVVLVVNEFLQGGWLEFLGSVRFRDDEGFDGAAELQRSEAAAAEGVVMTEISDLLLAAPDAQVLSLSGNALSLLSADVAKLKEQGRQTDAAIAMVLQSWRFVLERVDEALSKAGSDFPQFPISPTELEDMRSALSCGYHKGEIVQLLQTTREKYTKKVEANCTAAAMAALKAESLRLRGAELPTKILQVLQQAATGAIMRGEDAADVARQSVQDWLQVEARIRERIEALREENISADSLPSAVTSKSESVEEQLLAAAADSVCFRGETEEQAIDGVIHRWHEERASERAVNTLEAVIAEGFSGSDSAVCRAGCTAVLCGLENQPDLNGFTVQVETFNAEKGKWQVHVYDRQKRVMVKPQNLQPEPEDPGVNASTGNIPDVVAVLKPLVLQAVAEEGKELRVACIDEMRRWRAHYAQVESAVDHCAAEKMQLHVDEEARASMVFSIMASIWQEDKFDDCEWLSESIHSAVRTWEEQDRARQQEISQIESALEAAASSQRLLLTDAAVTTLKARVAAALRKGEDLESAVAAAVREWHKQVVRRQVQQTVWDPSDNKTRKVSGVVRFMPYKHSESDHLRYALLIDIFTMLPFNAFGAIAPVCKRWRSVVADPGWKPELVAYAWGAAQVTGLQKNCRKPTLLSFSIDKQVVRLTCADTATFALTESGDVHFWGGSWLPDAEPACPEPTRIPELRNVVSVSTTPPGYYHMRSRRPGYSCAAVARDGSLYTWGVNFGRQLLHDASQEVRRPRRVMLRHEDTWHPASERALQVAMGLDFMALTVQRNPTPAQTDGSAAAPDAGPARGETSVLTVGLAFRPSELHEWPELRGKPLRQLVAGCFHCCALTTRGELYTFGDEKGADDSNGNLLGLGRYVGRDAMAPRLVTVAGLGPVSEVSCSSYSSMAITTDGRVFSWGDCDGGALGHEEPGCHRPKWIKALRWHRVAHGSLAYTNAAVATDEGRVFVWGGGCWEGGIAAGRGAAGPSEVTWNGVPSCYRLSSASLAHRHGYLVFRKQP